MFVSKGYVTLVGPNSGGISIRMPFLKSLNPCKKCHCFLVAD